MPVDSGKCDTLCFEEIFYCRTNHFNDIGINLQVVAKQKRDFNQTFIAIYIQILTSKLQLFQFYIIRFFTGSQRLICSAGRRHPFYHTDTVFFYSNRGDVIMPLCIWVRCAANQSIFQSVY